MGKAESTLELGSRKGGFKGTGLHEENQLQRCQQH